jgi:hypothetical protein
MVSALCINISTSRGAQRYLPHQTGIAAGGDIDGMA